ncbi:MAG: PrsW family glutamic-type intramembrane protease [Parcubacteria group bacterium]|jgi:hypothetical protein
MNNAIKIKLLLFGVIAAFGSLFFELAVSIFFPGETAFLFDQITLLLIFFVIIEELIKFFVIWKSVSFFQNARDFFLGACLIGFGFSLTEIIFASLNVAGGQHATWLPFLGIFVVHTSTCVILGYGIYLKKRSTIIIPLVSILIVFLLHLIYNILVIYGTGASIILSYLCILFILSIAVGKKLQKQQGLKNNLPKI